VREKSDRELLQLKTEKVSDRDLVDPDLFSFGSLLNLLEGDL